MELPRRSRSTCAGPTAELAATVQSCNGCGRCRTQSPEYRMCPIFRILPSEEAAPRAKANLVRSVLSGALPIAELSSDAMKQVADLCVNCHQCRLECPAGVDIPKIVMETKAQHVAVHGLPTMDRVIGRLDWLANLGMIFRPLANWALGNRGLRWLLERTTGIARNRKLPRLAKQTFLRMARRRRLTKPVPDQRRKVLYFVDVYANWFDVELAEATVAVLEHNGVSVYVHPEQVPSGMARIGMGDVDRAKLMAKINVAHLAEAIRQGYEVITSEPSAALCLKHEYLNLLGDEDTQLVAQNTRDVCDYLWQLHKAGQLELDLKPQNISAGYHLPCHVKVMSPEAPAELLLRLIPGLTVERIEKGCSGMAGVYGLKAENFRNSLRAGFGLISALRNPRFTVGSHGMQCVQNADGARHRQAHDPPPEAAGPLVRLDARDCPFAQVARRGVVRDMIVNVQLFAAARDRAGSGVVQLNLPDDATVADLRRQLVAQFPTLVDIVPRAMIAVEADYASDSVPLRSTSEIALIPPVSGG